MKTSFRDYKLDNLSVGKSDEPVLHIYHTVVQYLSDFLSRDH